MILKCKTCGNYTLEESHCGRPTDRARPAPLTDSETKNKYRRKTKLSSR